MKSLKALITMGFIIMFFNSFAQLKNFPMLLCKDDTMIVKYLDSLNMVEGNPNYKVVKKITDTGNLLLTETFAIDDEPYYTCYDLIFKFIKLGRFNVCVREDVLSTGDYAAPNINYIIDNFSDKISENNWEMRGPPELPIIIDATIVRNQDNFCQIRYSIKDLDR
jgi:hypothetical protein